MADRGNELPEMPDNWGEYSRMLGDLPLRSLPQGADGRLHARLASAVANPRPRRTWLVGGLSLGSVIAVIAGIAIFSPGEEPAPRAASRPAVITEEKPKHRYPRRIRQPRPIAPQVSEVPVPIDTNVPHQIPLDQRQPEVTTGVDRRDARPGTTAANPARPRSEHRSTP